MTAFRVSMAITGDASDAKAAVNEAVGDLKRLETAAKTTGEAAGQALGQGGAEGAGKLNQAVKLSQQQMAQLQFQVNDMATGLVSGQSPFTVMMQQGLQMSQMFAAETGVKGALRGVGQGIVQFITNPMNLAVVGAGLAATAIAGVATAVLSNWPSANAIIEEHAALVKRIGESWDAARGKAKDYATETRGTMLANAMGMQGKLEDAFSAALTDLTRGAMGAGKSVIRAPQGSVLGGLSLGEIRAAGDAELNRLVDGFLAGLRNGTADVVKFRDALGLLQASTGDAEVRRLAAALIDNTSAAAAAQQEVARNRDLVKGLSGDQAALNKALGEGSAQADKLTGSLNGMARGMAEAFAKAERGFTPGLITPPVSPLAGKSLLDLIGAAEGTDKGRGYNETLGYGRFTGGNVDLVTMTLREVVALQEKMLAHPDNSFNSSALGRYQITRETLLDFMPRLSLSMDDVFTPAVQDRLALAIANAAGRDPDRLRGRWEGFNRIDEGLILSSFDRSSGDRAGMAQQMASASTKASEAAARAYVKVLEHGAREEQSWAEAIARRGDALTRQAAMLGKTAEEQAKLRVEAELWARADAIFGDRLKDDPALLARVTAEIEKMTAATLALADAETQAAARKRVAEAETARLAAMQMRQQISVTEELKGAASGMASTFAQAFQQTGSAAQAAGSVLDAVLNKLLGSLDRLLDKLVGGLIDGFLNQMAFDMNGGFYAKGGGFDGVTAFAGGGRFTNSVVSSPTFFRYGGGKLGLMGEAGPEAILPLDGAHNALVKLPGGEGRAPLTRLSDGSLGIDLSGMASPATGFARGGRFGEGASSGGRDIKVNALVKNYEAAPVRTQARQTASGDVDIEVIVGGLVGRKLASGDFDGIMTERYGVARRVSPNG